MIESKGRGVLGRPVEPGDDSVPKTARSVEHATAVHAFFPEVPEHETVAELFLPLK
ncbi:hypothetical protein [Bradyrhizobium liaoningense]